MTIKTTKTKYYSAKRALSYNTPFIFSLGNRSIGKTFDWTCRCINNFLNKGKKFIYMRRYDEDLKRTAPSFFDNVSFKYPTTKFEVCGSGKSGTTFKINDKVAGICISLSLATKYKSIGFADYDIILFDEFLPEDGRYLPSEVGNAMNFYQSVARGYGEVIRTDVKFVFLANNVTMYNPYFIELHILDQCHPDTHYTVDPDRAWVVEMINNKEIADEIANTPFGKMIAKTKYGEYALKSSFYLDNDTFIEKLEGNSKYYCTLAAHGKKYGVYEYTEQGLFYISEKYDKNNPNVFALTTEDHKPNYIMIYRNSQNGLFMLLKFAFDNAMIRFQNGLCKAMFLEFMAYSI